MKCYYFLLVVMLISLSGRINPQQSSVGLKGTHKNAYTIISAPSIYTYRTQLNKTATADFNTHYNYPSPPVQVQLAVEYAIRIWEF